ncbi:MAG: OmpA family protein [bacterium]|nr:OmpA family protein [bacterium]
MTRALFLAAIALAVACSSSDNGSPKGDSGLPDGHQGSDAGTNADASADAGPACDPSKPFGTPVAVTALNQAGEDTNSVRLSSDELTAYLTRAGVAIYSSTRATKITPWSQPAPVAALDTTGNEAHATVTADGLTLYLQVQPATGGSDIFVSTRADVASAFSTPVAVPVINDTVEDLAPYISADGNVLYFSTRRPAAFGTDPNIYRAEKTGGAFGAPAFVLGINHSPGYDSMPVPSADETKIFLASDRGGVGFNIYMATRPSTAVQYGNPSLVTELNSTFADFPSYLSADGCTIYLSSNRAGAGVLDIYMATRPL